MRTPSVHRSRSVPSAALAALALAAGLTSPVAVAAGGAPAGVGRAAGVTELTLVTGDRVTVDAGGRPVGLVPAEGRKGIPVALRSDRGRTSFVPLDAQPLIDSGRLDPRLFDLTALTRPEYRRARGDRLQLIVRYEGSAPAARSALRAGGAARVQRTYRTLDAESVTVDPAKAATLWKELTVGAAGSTGRSAAPGIAAVWLDGVRTATLDRSTRQIGADKAWAAGYDGKGVKIAVLDTGIDGTHPDLAGKVVAARDFAHSGSTADRFGHGTHVASIAAGTGARSGGKYQGVAPGAQLLNGKVLDDSGAGDDSGILAGIEWAVAQGAQIVNLSLGGPDSPGTDPIEAAVDKLSATKGVLFTVAAGNGGRSGPGSIDSPGSAAAALTVGAVDGADALADFSGTGPRLGGGAVKPDVTAPGVDITAAAAPGSVLARRFGEHPDGYLGLSGTSMATPHAAGAAALLKQQHPTWTGAQLKGVLAGSAVPGRYSAYQQGSGRIAVDRAIRQSVIAEPLSLALTGGQWPHADDTPVSRTVTYRNLGAAPVTLKLSVAATGPDGRPAPAGFLAFAAPSVTVPAHGTASVALTLDTRLGGPVNGRYTAQALAAGAGQQVRTALIAEREVESYALTVHHLGRDGKHAKAYYTVLRGLTGPAADRRFENHENSRSETLRVPKGSYVLDSRLVMDPARPGSMIDWISQSRLDVSRATRVTVDARTTEPVDMTVPSGTAAQEFAAPVYQVRKGDLGYVFGWWLDSTARLRTRGQGPGPAAGTHVFQQWEAHWKDGADEYHTVLGGPVRRPATGYTRHMKPADLATVLVDHGTSGAAKEGSVSALGKLPGGLGGTSSAAWLPLPSSVRMYLSAVDGARWQLSATRFGVHGSGYAEEGTYTAERAYQGGRTYRERFGTAVVGPRVSAGAGLGLSRSGNTIRGTVPLLADGAGHLGTDLFARGRTTLYRNGAVIGTRSAELRDATPFTVPAGDAAYELVTSTARPGSVTRTSTQVSATWWFRSRRASAAAPVRIPASLVRFTPEVRPDGTVNGGHPMRVPVTVQGPAAGRGLKSLTVSVSYDAGRTWRVLPVRDGALTVQTPPAGGHVSLRGKVVDSAGNAAEVTILHAFRTD
ncbi:S8 family serine peptidase [Streptomyces sp. NPDC089919]|uniref:S8 family peptidase n=1 Tax=Streptomyces sp. NPDC089919 TaxID=3155188 RepID=UPI00342E8423